MTEWMNKRKNERIFANVYMYAKLSGRVSREWLDEWDDTALQILNWSRVSHAVSLKHIVITRQTRTSAQCRINVRPASQTVGKWKNRALGHLCAHIG